MIWKLTLVLSCYSVFGHVCVYHRTSLQKKLPQKRLRDLLIKTTHIYSGIWK